MPYSLSTLSLCLRGLFCTSCMPPSPSRCQTPQASTGSTMLGLGCLGIFLSDILYISLRSGPCSLCRRRTCGMSGDPSRCQTRRAGKESKMSNLLASVRIPLGTRRRKKSCLQRSPPQIYQDCTRYTPFSRKSLAFRCVVRPCSPGNRNLSWRPAYRSSARACNFCRACDW